MVQGGKASWRTRPGAARGKQYPGPDAPLSREAGKDAGPNVIKTVSLKRKYCFDGGRLQALCQKGWYRGKTSRPCWDKEGFFIYTVSMISCANDSQRFFTRTLSIMIET
ncbi:MAG TPA: hypothetical protein DCZ10_00635 [Pelotomaculum sp.]|nr:hypothetical protein [Pelotomaculum sp.]